MENHKKIKTHRPRYTKIKAGLLYFDEERNLENIKINKYLRIIKKVSAMNSLKNINIVLIGGSLNVR